MASGTAIGLGVRWKVRKRAVPSFMVAYSTASSTADQLRDRNLNVDVGAEYSDLGETGVFVRKATTGTDQNRYSFHWETGAEL